VGCGIGGPSRYLAKRFGCRVTGLDLTPEFFRVAGMLAERTGLSEKVDYCVGDGPAVPFPAATRPNSKEYCEKMLAEVDDEQRYKILRGNAIRMLGLELG